MYQSSDNTASENTAIQPIGSFMPSWVTKKKTKRISGLVDVKRKMTDHGFKILHILVQTPA